MNNDRSTLAQAFIEAEKRDYETVDTALFWTPSDKFSRSMDSLIKKERSIFWKYINTSGKKAAAVIIACLLLSGCAMSIEAVRTPFIRFVTEIYETFTKIFTDDLADGTDQEAISQKLSPSFMIEGYEQTSEISDALTYQLRWSSESGGEIVYQQSLLKNFSAVIDTEKAPYEYIETDHGEAIYFKSNDKHSLIWNDGSYTFKITSPISVSIDDLVRLANSVK